MRELEKKVGWQEAARIAEEEDAKEAGYVIFLHLMWSILIISMENTCVHNGRIRSTSVSMTIAKHASHAPPRRKGCALLTPVFVSQSFAGARRP